MNTLLTLKQLIDDWEENENNENNADNNDEDTFCRQSREICIKDNVFEIISKESLHRENIFLGYSHLTDQSSRHEGFEKLLKN